MDQTVSIWDLSRTKCLDKYHAHTASVTCIAWQPLGLCVLELILAHSNHSGGFFFFLCFRVDYLLASGGVDGRIAVYDISSKKLQKKLRVHNRVCISTCFCKTFIPSPVFVPVVRCPLTIDACLTLATGCEFSVLASKWLFLSFHLP